MYLTFSIINAVKMEQKKKFLMTYHKQSIRNLFFLTKLVFVQEVERLAGNTFQVLLEKRQILD